ncbi:MAG TPA: hypothetical protein VLQ93_16040 [Myxococcaceae bacterium]|nr:hypothetical protein [Myxococcaceae bacterium]
MRILVLLGLVSIAWAGCGHVRSERFGARIHVVDEDASGVGSALGVGCAGYDCDDELKDCFKRCWESSRQPYPHVEHDEWYYEYCTRKCRKEYMECVEELEREEAERIKKRPPLQFSSLDGARAWIRAHKAEIALGAVVIVAGTAFILATGAAGALILVPLAL